MPLDIQAARAVAQARLFERAVHDPGPWSIRIGEVEEYAVRARTNVGVVFIAHFDAGAVDEVAWLLCKGEEVSSKEIRIDDEAEGFALEWKLTLNEPESIRV